MQKTGRGLFRSQDRISLPQGSFASPAAQGIDHFAQERVVVGKGVGDLRRPRRDYTAPNQALSFQVGQHTSERLRRNLRSFLPNFGKTPRFVDQGAQYRKGPPRPQLAESNRERARPDSRGGPWLNPFAKFVGDRQIRNSPCNAQQLIYEANCITTIYKLARELVPTIKLGRSVESGIPFVG